jgi:hypothetical protein
MAEQSGCHHERERDTPSWGSRVAATMSEREEIYLMGEQRAATIRERDTPYGGAGSCHHRWKRDTPHGGAGCCHHKREIHIIGEQVTAIMGEQATATMGDQHHGQPLPWTATIREQVATAIGDQHHG